MHRPQAVRQMTRERGDDQKRHRRSQLRENWSTLRLRSGANASTFARGRGRWSELICTPTLYLTQGEKDLMITMTMMEHLGCKESFYDDT